MMLIQYCLTRTDFIFLRKWFIRESKAFPVYPPSSVAPLPTTAAARAKQEAMASETDHGEALAGAHARYNPHITAIPLLLAPRCLLRPRAHPGLRRRPQPSVLPAATRRFQRS